jgi:proteasome lid subunit RPN8/RPN11
MDVRIASELLDAIVAEAAGTPECEVCGLLFGCGARQSPVRPGPVEGRASDAAACNTSFDFTQDERVAGIGATPNVAVDPVHSFEIDPVTLFAAIRAERAGGPRILGHYHSHPNGASTPSPRDAAMADRPGRLWLIVANGAVQAWRECPGGPVHAAFEPVRLVVDRTTSGCA